jgi:hypothetical protein
MKHITPRKNCGTCKGLGYILYADSFDRDNWEPCFTCKRRARAKKVKLKIMYPAGAAYV